MTLVFLHGLFGALLMASLFSDVFFLRSASSTSFEPKSGMASWRKFNAVFQMIAFVIVFTLGLVQWLPNSKVYPGSIFHTKMGLALVFLVLSKVRLFREKKSGEPAVLLTRILFALVFILFSLGLSYGKMSL
jgi:phosphatidylglycerophosphate synthase